MTEGLAGEHRLSRGSKRNIQPISKKGGVTTFMSHLLFLYSSSKKKINLETVNYTSSSASGNRWNLISSLTAIGTIDKIPTKNQ